MINQCLSRRLRDNTLIVDIDDHVSVKRDTLTPADWDIPKE